MIEYREIGVIRTPHTDVSNMPIQPAGAEGVKGSVEVHPEFVEGLSDLDGFSHVLLVYHLHEVRETKLTVTPFMDTERRGVFATRAPARPNPIGISIVRLEGVRGAVLDVDGVDMLDGTPLLDIKPYVPEVDERTDVRVGWLEGARERWKEKASDDRFR